MMTHIRMNNYRATAHTTITCGYSMIIHSIVFEAKHPLSIASFTDLYAATIYLILLVADLVNNPSVLESLSYDSI